MPDDARGRERVDQRPQRPRQRERIDERDAVVEQQLHDHQVRRVRFLGMELGVQTDARRRDDALAQPRQALRRVDDGYRLARVRGDAHVCTGAGTTMRSGVACTCGRLRGKRMWWRSANARVGASTRASM